VIIPFVGSRSLRLQHLCNTIAASPTFQRLVGANFAEQAKNSVYPVIALDAADVAEDNPSDPATPESVMPIPRAIVRHLGTQAAELMGMETFNGSGQATIYLQIYVPTDDQLLAFYNMTGSVGEDDRRIHIENLFGSISDELRSVARMAGGLMIKRLEEYSCGPIDPVTENGLELIEFVWVIHWGGLP
jgi:hypothetical protein